MGKPERKPSRFGPGAKAALGVAAMAVDSTDEMLPAQPSVPVTDAAAPSAASDEPAEMEAEVTKAKKTKVKAAFPVVVKKRGSGSKVQKKRKLKRLQKALAHQEKLVSKDAREERTKAKRNEAKSLWGASKADTNKFAALAT
mmetsp:Transcript_4870/g.14010  ORF Transcript_4870/g.14010 Transcript_4870/m.14010 type:complete len:142 (-) Transcript_4870:807-1232(-)